MRIMLDANFLISVLFFPKPDISKIFKHIVSNYTIVLSDYTQTELVRVTDKKFSDKNEVMDKFLTSMSYELYVLDYFNPNDYPFIRDRKDLPVLVSAIKSNVDMLITGDKDFVGVKTDTPRILTARQYHDEFIVS